MWIFEFTALPVEQLVPSYVKERYQSQWTISGGDHKEWKISRCCVLVLAFFDVIQFKKALVMVFWKEGCRTCHKQHMPSILWSQNYKRLSEAVSPAIEALLRSFKNGKLEALNPSFTVWKRVNGDSITSRENIWRKTGFRRRHSHENFFLLERQRSLLFTSMKTKIFIEFFFVLEKHFF